LKCYNKRYFEEASVVYHNYMRSAYICFSVTGNSSR